MTHQWFSLPDVPVGNRNVSAEIRTWEAGDGLACRGAAQSLRVPCGPPIAVVRSVSTRQGEAGRATISVYCERHVTEVVRRQVGDADWRGTTSTQETIKRAEETVIAAHWDEYQAALETAIAEKREHYFAALPDWLRAGFESAEEQAE